MMDKEPKGSAAETDASGEVTEPKTDKVDHKTYLKVLAEAKKAKAEREELAERMKALEAEKLEAQGKEAEKADFFKKRAQELEGKYKETVKAYGSKVISAQIKGVAKDLGCVDPDALLALGKWDTLTVGEDFEVEPEQVKALVTELQAAKPYLFKKNAPGVQDLPPKSGGANAAPTKLGEMSKADLVQLFKKVSK